MEVNNNTKLLYEAAEFAGFEAKLGWPEELTIKQLISLIVGHEFFLPLGDPEPVVLIYPDGSQNQIGQTPNLKVYERSTEREKMRKNCENILKIIYDAKLKTEERTEVIHRPPKKIFSIKNLSVVKFVEQEHEIKRRLVVTKQTAEKLFKSIDIDMSDYFYAWLGIVRKNDTSSGKNIIRKRKVLVHELCAIWPSIEKDLSDSNRNGLSKKAKTKRHGYWDAEYAITWASENGKITKAKANEYIRNNDDSDFLTILKQSFSI